MNAIEKAILIVGSQAELARTLGVTPQQVHEWKRGGRPVPLRYADAITAATHGGVTIDDLHPDLAAKFRRAKS